MLLLLFFMVTFVSEFMLIVFICCVCEIAGDIKEG